MMSIISSLRDELKFYVFFSTHISSLQDVYKQRRAIILQKKEICATWHEIWVETESTVGTISG